VGDRGKEGNSDANQPRVWINGNELVSGGLDGFRWLVTGFYRSPLPSFTVQKVHFPLFDLR